MFEMKDFGRILQNAVLKGQVSEWMVFEDDCALSDDSICH